ncbi:MAG: thaumatin family protein [Candidatus Binatus sp.]|uniref:thaumatin family protein n=1 Tax=Candidatus Binatus sp. TaxID=2811406 RepID=UPI00272687DA|nr:thaumatin family protein [Candidatus Binatus sp.]MDO8432035.1 thaumatin family protein [Candidatus Binatus sp.]
MNRLIRYFSQCAIMIVALLLISSLSSNSRDALAAAPTTHEINFANNCPQPIWIAAFSKVQDVTPAHGWELAPSCNAASANPCPGSGSKCVNSQCSCPAAAASNTTNCYGAACVAGATGKFHCATETSLLVPAAYPSARIWGRTGCTGSGANLSCDTGDCGGKLDCFGVGTANRATLFEMSLAGLSGQDNYDVSLVSGYNVPLTVQAVPPTDTLGWKPSSPYHNGQGGLKQSVITASAGSFEWLFNDATGSATTANSGTVVPKFSTVLGGNVPDPSTSTSPYKLAWRTTTSTCQTGACSYSQTAPDPLLTTCPAVLRVTDSSLSCTAASDCPRKAPCSGGHCVTACDSPDDYCAGAGAGTPTCSAQNNSFFLCANKLTTERDPFGNPINLVSANAGTPICFSADDCAPGTKCIFNPTFTAASKITFPAGAGVCVPGNGTIPQNGACTSTADDGKVCPSASFIFPFPGYKCGTLTNDGSGAQLTFCVPPITATATGNAAFGELVWNADNFTATATTCTSDSGCATGQYCLEKTVRKFPASGAVQAQAVTECSGASDPEGCVCNDVKSCSSNSDCTASTNCLNKQGLACTGGQCICQVNSVYTGVCGAVNQNWTNANNQIKTGSNNYISIFKAACPSAYSYQFDDTSSDWSCTNTTNLLVNYTVSFCGNGGKGL